MSDAPKAPLMGPTTIGTQPGFPPPQVPTLFCDGIANVAPSGQVVKFYLYRTDPDMGGQPLYQNQVFLQIAMATDTFAATCIFFERALKHMISLNLIAQERVDELNKSYNENIGVASSQ